jgi:hypothetical protein
MDLEGPRKPGLIDGKFEEPICTDSLHDAGVQEDSPFSLGDEVEKPKMEKTLHHHKNHVHSLEKKSSFQKDSHILQTWQILEQHHTKSKSISVPKNRRKLESSAF